MGKGARRSPQTGAGGALPPKGQGGEGDARPAPHTPAQSILDSIGIVALLIDHKDGTLFLSDIYPSVAEAKEAASGLPDKLAGFAAVVPL